MFSSRKLTQATYDSIAIRFVCANTNPDHPAPVSTLLHAVAVVTADAFGIKAGLIGLHMWLPLAHPAAPVAASAVLSVAMIKAGLIGWLRYLPLGQQALPELGALPILASIAAALLAVPAALVQRDPKVVLAYSSIAKMGTMIAGLGIAVMVPALAPAMIAALIFYATNHGLAKGVLFLGVGVVKGSSSRWPLLVLASNALVLAGAPFTGRSWRRQSWLRHSHGGRRRLWAAGSDGFRQVTCSN